MKREVERDYVDNVGKPHENLPDDHPDVWQWQYRGTPEERAALLERLVGEHAEREDPPSQNEALFE